MQSLIRCSFRALRLANSSILHQQLTSRTLTPVASYSNLGADIIGWFKKCSPQQGKCTQPVSDSCKPLQSDTNSYGVEQDKGYPPECHQEERIGAIKTSKDYQTYGVQRDPPQKTE